MSPNSLPPITQKITAISLIFFAVAFYAMPSSAQNSLMGNASVIDGDTIEIHGSRIRLHGIDAPEAGQTCLQNNKAYRCGQKAALFLDTLIGSSTVSCEKKDTDRYDRTIAECFSGAINLNESMVRNGWALAYQKYNHDYISAENIAKNEKLGMWAGEFQAPWDFRRSPTSEEIQNSKGCLIKGNINSQGRKIYHVPGTSAYGRTIINEEKGERWFCTEQQAIDSGWHPVSG